MGMVAPKAHQSGRMKSAASPSTVNESQKILRSMLWIVVVSTFYDLGRRREGKLRFPIAKSS